MVVADNLATGLFQINVDKIVTVKYATYAAAKRKPEKIRFAGIQTLASAILCCTLGNQLS